jgi:phosphatidylserine/phosphatidylglycerophosphate/cardiolipin synthase-like enzyme
MREGVRQSETATRAARDRFPFTREGIAALRRLVTRLRTENIEVRRYERAFLHAKAYMFASPDRLFGGQAGVIAGSSNLTGGGLASNLELNLGRYDDPVVGQAREWFEDIWADAEPVDLAGLYEEIFAAYTPWEIFLRILYQLYGGRSRNSKKTTRDCRLLAFRRTVSLGRCVWSGIVAARLWPMRSGSEKRSSPLR